MSSTELFNLSPAEVTALGTKCKAEYDDIMKRGKELEAAIEKPKEEDEGGVSTLHKNGGIDIQAKVWGYRVRVHQPTLRDLIKGATFEGILVSIAALAISHPLAGPIAVVIGTLIFLKSEYIARTDKGNGIYFDLTWSELAFLIPNYYAITVWVMAKSVYAQ